MDCPTATAHHQADIPNPGNSEWRPAYFLISSVIFFLIGGALTNRSLASIEARCPTSGRYAEYSLPASCFRGNDVLFYSEITCFVVACITGLIAWILLIVHGFKHHRQLILHLLYDGVRIVLVSAVSLYVLLNTAF